MDGNVKKYIAGIGPSLPLEIISAAACNKLNQMANLFSDFAASEYIFESNLGTEAAEIDFSFRVLTEEKDCLDLSTLSTDRTWNRISNFLHFWSQGIEDIWFEMDYAEHEKALPQPCFFFNASQIKKGNQVDYHLLFGALKQLLENGQLKTLEGNIKDVIEHLPTKVGLFQVGIMLARHSDRVRIFTTELTKIQVIEYLANIGWTGSINRLEQLFKLIHQYSDGQYIVDFDVTSTGISEKIGINFGLDKRKTLPAFLDNLVNHQLCSDLKRKGVLAWLGSKGSFLGPDYGFSALIKDISHFKVSYLPADGLKAKAYLRVKGIYLKELYKAKVPSQDQEVKLGYKELQNVFKEIAKRSMLDKEYRELCLKDSVAAIKKVIGSEAAVPNNIIFLEQDGESIDSAGVVYILPPFLKQSWLLSK
ncbi:MAG: hypothetical protein FH758_10785 [Firmicutes bacterium]|nr:hypothetical protein [Bacillota bacterium]